MTSRQLYRTAKQTVERRRQAAETAAIHARRSIYAAVPMLAELDLQKAAAGSTAARFAADGDKAMASLRLTEMHDIAERRRLLLSQHGYSESAMQPAYTCPICQDTGVFNSNACQCVLEEIKRLRRDDVNSAGPLTLCRFENFSLSHYPESLDDSFAVPQRIMADILQNCKDYAADFGPYSGSIFMFGYAGLGKTHLALSIASEVLDKGFDVIYVSAQSAFATISASRWEADNALFYSMLNCDLLVLDDLGIEFVDAYTLSRLYELVNTRARKPTIYTTNICSDAELQQRYTEKISSRLLGECHPMRFWGTDIRQLLK